MGLTTEEFIRRGRESHGDKYDYSRTRYVRTKVEIICPAHGPFRQWPQDHWRKAGCPTCANRSRSMSRAEFVARSNEIHGDRYDYSPVQFVNTKTKVEILCAEHGTFWQRPDHHLRGHGCPECGEATGRFTTEEFVARLNAMHGERYDYRLVEYQGMSEKVEVICREHGVFWQEASSVVSAAES